MLPSQRPPGSAHPWTGRAKGSRRPGGGRGRPEAQTARLVFTPGFRGVSTHLNGEGGWAAGRRGGRDKWPQSCSSGPARVRKAEAINYPAGPAPPQRAGRGVRRSVNRPFHHWRPRTKEKLCFIKATSALWPPGQEAPTARLGAGRAGGSAAPRASEKGPFRRDRLQPGVHAATPRAASRALTPQALRHGPGPLWFPEPACARPEGSAPKAGVLGKPPLGVRTRRGQEGRHWPCARPLAGSGPTQWRGSSRGDHDHRPSSVPNPREASVLSWLLQLWGGGSQEAVGAAWNNI